MFAAEECVSYFLEDWLEMFFFPLTTADDIKS
jgi:hypothetical protein